MGGGGGKAGRRNGFIHDNLKCSAGLRLVSKTGLVVGHGLDVKRDV